VGSGAIGNTSIKRYSLNVAPYVVVLLPKNIINRQFCYRYSLPFTDTNFRLIFQVGQVCGNCP